MVASASLVSAIFSSGEIKPSLTRLLSHPHRCALGERMVQAHTSGNGEIARLGVLTDDTILSKMERVV